MTSPPRKARLRNEAATLAPVGGRGRLPDGGSEPILALRPHRVVLRRCGPDELRRRIAGGWRAFFADLPEGACILDLCTGNGAAALIAAEDKRRGERSSRSTRPTSIRPPSSAAMPSSTRAIDFRGRTDVEALPFGDGGFDAVVSQYGIEYSDLSKSLPEAVRMLAPGGRIRLVVHAADGVVARERQGGDRRCRSAARRRSTSPATPPAASRPCSRSSATAATPPRRTRASPPSRRRSRAPRAMCRRRADRTMFRNSGAVLLDTFQRRGHFDLEQLLAKVDAGARRDRRPSRPAGGPGRSRRSTRSGAAALADRLRALGGIAASRPLDMPQRPDRPRRGGALSG